MSGQRTFTETIQASPIYTNTGNVFSCRFIDIPQHTEYSTLFKQFCIKKMKVILLPNYTEVDPNNAIGLTTFNLTQPRLTYAIDDSPNLTAPTSELDVLQSNGAKIRNAGKKLEITFKPKPNIASLEASLGAYVGLRQKADMWLNTDSSTVSYSGTGLQHCGVRYWLSGQVSAVPYLQYNVYYKITFSVRDPA